MCRAMEEMRDESIREGERKKAIENARTMLLDGLPIETIARYAGLSVSDVETLKNQMNH